MHPDKLKELASQYTVEHCRKLLELDPGGCGRLYFTVRKDLIVEEAKKVENKNAVRLALMDGPKSLSEIVQWARSQNAGALSMATCNLVLSNFRETKEASWDGSQWSATPEIAPISPEPAAKPRHEWTSVISSAADLGMGGSVVIDVPDGCETRRYASNLRAILFSRKETRDFKWSIARLGRRVRLTRVSGEMPVKLDLHVDAVISDIDRKIADLEVFKENLQKFHREKRNCQSS